MHDRVQHNFFYAFFNVVDRHRFNADPDLVPDRRALGADPDPAKLCRCDRIRIHITAFYENICAYNLEVINNEFYTFKENCKIPY